MRALVITYPTPRNIKSLIALTDSDYVIAVDKAVACLKEQKIPINLAIGDFDSLIDKKMLSGIKSIALDAQKDETDTLYAVDTAYQLKPSSVLVLGGLGGVRVEHTFANLKLFYKYHDLIIKDEYATIKRLGVGRHAIDFDGYISFFGLENSIISLKHFKYPLDHYQMTINDSLGISNEMIKSPAMIEIHEGSIICFLTQRDT